jgi:hypothetical protein
LKYSGELLSGEEYQSSDNSSSTIPQVEEHEPLISDFKLYFSFMFASV